HYVIQETTGGNQAAVSVTGGTVDLGTTADAGGNTLNLNGPGEFFHNAGPNPVSQIGDTFTIDGTVLRGSGIPVHGFERAALASAPVARFTAADGNAPASGFTALIAWGDGSTSAGDVTR